MHRGRTFCFFGTSDRRWCQLLLMYSHVLHSPCMAFVWYIYWQCRPPKMQSDRLNIDCKGSPPLACQDRQWWWYLRLPRAGSGAVLKSCSFALSVYACLVLTAASSPALMFVILTADWTAFPWCFSLCRVCWSSYWESMHTFDVSQSRGTMQTCGFCLQRSKSVCMWT